MATSKYWLAEKKGFIPLKSGKYTKKQLKKLMDKAWHDGFRHGIKE